MRILLIGNFLSTVTGIESVSEELARRLSDLDWTVLITSQNTGRLARLKDILLTILTRHSEYEIAHIEVYSGLAFSIAEIAGLTLKAVKKPYLLTLHGGNLPAFARCWPGRVKRLLQGASAITAPSNYLQQEMRYYQEDIVLIPNPLDIKKYPFRLRSIPNLRLIWLRAFHQIYNPGLAPRALSILSSEFPTLHLVMIGPDKGDGSLLATQKIAHDLGVEHMITYPGAIPKSKVPEILQKGDIFINTTNIDNTPVSVMEAMACGMCIVSTNVGGIPYLLRNGEDALLVPPDDPKAMVDAIRLILTEPGLAAYLSFNARRKAEQFDWQVILPKWEGLFERISDA